MLKICIISPEYPAYDKSDAALVAQNLAQNLTGFGHQVSVVTASKPEILTQDKQVQIHKIIHSKPFTSAQYWSAFINRERPQIIHWIWPNDNFKDLLGYFSFLNLLVAPSCLLYGTRLMGSTLRKLSSLEEKLLKPLTSASQLSELHGTALTNSKGLTKFQNADETKTLTWVCTDHGKVSVFYKPLLEMLKDLPQWKIQFVAPTHLSSSKRNTLEKMAAQHGLREKISWVWTKSYSEKLNALDGEMVLFLEESADTLSYHTVQTIMQNGAVPVVLSEPAQWKNLLYNGQNAWLLSPTKPEQLWTIMTSLKSNPALGDLQKDSVTTASALSNEGPINELNRSYIKLL